MNIWILSDTHFSHDKLVEEGQRPIEFAKKIMKNLDLTVKQGDVLLHLGDICFGDEVLWHTNLSTLPCKRWLVRGNHDKKSLTWYLTKGWDMVVDSFTADLFGKKILFSHIPQEDNGYDLNVHGHFHDYSDEIIRTREPHIHAIRNSKQFLISLEQLRYQPIKLDRVVEEFKKRTSSATKPD